MLRLFLVLLTTSSCTTANDCKCADGEWFEAENECKVVLYITDPCYNQKYDPVCGCDNQVYDNECIARRNGIKFFRDCKIDY